MENCRNFLKMGSVFFATPCKYTFIYGYTVSIKKKFENALPFVASEATERAKPATSQASFSKLHTVRKKSVYLEN